MKINPKCNPRKGPATSCVLPTKSAPAVLPRAFIFFEWGEATRNIRFMPGPGGGCPSRPSVKGSEFRKLELRLDPFNMH